jgi:hypothetical protein
MTLMLRRNGNGCEFEAEHDDVRRVACSLTSLAANVRAFADTVGAEGIVARRCDSRPSRGDLPYPHLIWLWPSAEKAMEKPSPPKT